MFGYHGRLRGRCPDRRFGHGVVVVEVADGVIIAEPMAEGPKLTTAVPDHRLAAYRFPDATREEVRADRDPVLEASQASSSMPPCPPLMG